MVTGYQKGRRGGFQERLWNSGGKMKKLGVTHWLLDLVE